MLISACILFLSSLLPPSTGMEDDSNIVSLKQGKILGLKEISTKGKEFYSFYGIPYAKSPIDLLRFMKPEPFERWEGLRNGTSIPDECSQMLLIDLMKNWDAIYAGREDCLIVNVHTPNIAGKTDLPVLVYLHGGAFVCGGNTIYEPHELLNEEVVLVIVQYRVGALGFLSTEDSIIPGNQGLRDQSLALKWVKDNIASFSGDDNRITLFGTSAGGASVHAHILSDYSNGLFSRAILQSGTLLCPWARMVDPRKVAMKLGDHFECFKNNPQIADEERSRILLSCLQGVDAKALQLATHQFFKWTFLPGNTVPFFDGDFFTHDFETLIKNGKLKDVDVIYGVTKDEGAFFVNSLLSMDSQRKAIKEDFSTVGPISLGFENEENAINLSRAVYDYYVGGVKNEISDYENLKQMYGHRHFSICTDLAALFHAEKNQKAEKATYFYELHHKGTRTFSSLFGDPFPSKYWVSHGDETFYLFPITVFGAIKRNDVDSKMRDLFTKMWVNFARDGNPTPDNSLGFHWQPFTPEKPKHLKITPNPIMEDDLRRKEREFWKSLPLQENKPFFGDEEVKTIKEEL